MTKRKSITNIIDNEITISVKFVNNAISIKKEAIVKASIDIFPYYSPSFYDAEFKFEVITNKSVNIL